MTQVPTAKYPPRSRKASPAVGTAKSAATTPAMGTQTNGLMPELLGEDPQRVGPDADEGLLTHRDKSGVAGQQVPHLGQRHQGEEGDRLFHDRWTIPRRVWSPAR